MLKYFQYIIIYINFLPHFLLHTYRIFPKNATKKLERRKRRSKTFLITVLNKTWENFYKLASEPYKYILFIITHFNFIFFNLKNSLFEF